MPDGNKADPPRFVTANDAQGPALAPPCLFRQRPPSNVPIPGRHQPRTLHDERLVYESSPASDHGRRDDGNLRSGFKRKKRTEPPPFGPGPSAHRAVAGETRGLRPPARPRPVSRLCTRPAQRPRRVGPPAARLLQPLESTRPRTVSTAIVGWKRARSPPATPARSSLRPGDVRGAARQLHGWTNPPFIRQPDGFFLSLMG